jgi:hypothetical protein
MEKIKEELSSEYLVIDNLPSNFRSYKINNIYIRGLYYIESEAIAKFTSQKRNIKNDLDQLMVIYKDTIKGIKIEELEYMDFLLLMVMIGTMTVTEFGWIPDLKCVNIVDNPKIPEIKKEIDKAVELLSNPEIKDEEIPQLEQIITELHQRLEEEPKEDVCNTKINTPITLDDFDFGEPVKIGIPVKLSELKITPIKVKDVLKINKFKNSDQYTKFKEKVEVYGLDEKTMDRVLLLSSLIENDKWSVKQKAERILKLTPKEMQKLYEIEQKFTIKQKPIIKKCPKCGYPNKIKITLEQIKVYP